MGTWDGRERRKRTTGIPYKVRDGLESLSAILTDILLAHRAYALELEDRLIQAFRVMGQVRSGVHDPEAPAAPRLKVARDPEQLPLWARLLD